jgi:hypothetical protein
VGREEHPLPLLQDVRRAAVRQRASGALGGDFYGIQVASLDNVDPAELAQVPVRFTDGRNNNWQSSPEHTCHL